MEFTFDLAAQQDDTDLRHLLAISPMPGRMAVTFEREPCYFWGCPTMGHFWQVLIARQAQSGELAGVICRATQPRYVNGQRQEIGYLGQLRIAEAYRDGRLLLEGVAHLRSLHADGRTSHYLIAISDENVTALGVLVRRPRRSFPRLHEITHLCTLGIILHRFYFEPKTPAGVQIERGSPQIVDEMVGFLQQHGTRRQFFPLYTGDDLLGRSLLLRDFRLADLAVARRHGKIVGVMGLWDQQGFKQTVVQEYNPSLHRLRPWYNLAATALGMPGLPGAGEHIRSAYAALVCIADDDTQIFRLLLRQIGHWAARRGLAYLMIGLADNDPLLSAAQKFPHILYGSRLYLANWSRDTAPELALDGRTPYIEIATL